MANRVEVRGLEESFARLREQAKQVQQKVLRSAVGKATRVMLKGQKRRVPVEVGRDELSRARSKRLKKSLGVKVKTYRASGVIVGLIGPRRGFREQVGVRTRGKNVGQPVYYDPAKTAHLVEKGTSRSAAKSFVRSTADAEAAEAARVFNEAVADGIKRWGK